MIQVAKIKIVRYNDRIPAASNADLIKPFRDLSNFGCNTILNIKWNAKNIMINNTKYNGIQGSLLIDGTIPK